MMEMTTLVSRRIFGNLASRPDRGSPPRLGLHERRRSFDRSPGGERLRPEPRQSFAVAK